jgi:hypothetical protein
LEYSNDPVQPVCLHKGTDRFLKFSASPIFVQVWVATGRKRGKDPKTTMAQLRRSVSHIAANVSKCAERFLLPSSSAGSGSSGCRLSTTSRKGTDPPDVVDSSQNFAEILLQVQDGSLSASQATRTIAASLEKQTTTLSRKKDDDDADDDPIRAFANLDLRRASRVAFPEAVFAQGKTAQQVAMILDRMAHAAVAARQSEEDDVNDEFPTPILATRYEFSLVITNPHFFARFFFFSPYIPNCSQLLLLQSDGNDVSRDSTIYIPEWVHTLL